jgi:disulfide bond formation protein DsbB
MLLHPELADFLNYYLSIATLVFAVILFAWAVDLFIIRLKYGPYKELRTVYKKIAEYTFPLGFFASLSGVFLSLFYSDYLGYPPCALCWFQRIALYPMVILFAIAWYKKDYTVYRYILGISGVGFVIALYHQYLQMGYNAFIPCAANAVFVDCAKPSFVEFGFVTFPFMALTLFSFMFLIALTLRMKVKRG